MNESHARGYSERGTANDGHDVVWGGLVGRRYSKRAWCRERECKMMSACVDVGVK